MVEKRDAALARLNSMSKEQLQQLLIDSAKKLGQAQRQIQQRDQQLEKQSKQMDQKDKLITTFSQQREQIQQEANSIIQTSKRQANQIVSEANRSAAQQKAEAVRMSDMANKKLEEAEAHAATIISNANAEADSIVATRTQECTRSIEKLARTREEAKRSTVTLQRAMMSQLDSMVGILDRQRNSCLDMQAVLSQSIADIESESFQAFNINDYVSQSTTPHIAAIQSEFQQPSACSVPQVRQVQPQNRSVLDVEQDNLSIDDDGIDDLSALLSANYVPASAPQQPKAGRDNLVTDSDLSFLNIDDSSDDDLANVDIDDDIFGTQTKSLKEIAEDTTDTIQNADPFAASNIHFDESKQKSFTGSFGAVKSSSAVIAPSSTYSDFEDMDVESLLDEDDDLAAVSRGASINIPKPAQGRRRKSTASPKSQFL